MFALAFLATWLSLSPAGDRISVAWDGASPLLEFDTVTGTQTGTGTNAKPPTAPPAVCRQPWASALTPAGDRLFVTCLLPEQAATALHVAARVVAVDTRTRSTISILLPNGSTSARGIAVTPDGRWAFVAHIIGRYTVPASQLEQGWINTNALSIIDVRRGELHATVLLDDPAHGAANPWAVAISPDGKRLYVTHAGTHELSEIDILALIEKIAKSGASASQQLGFLQGVRRRIPLPGKGPRALAVSRDQVWVAEYFTRTLTRVSPSPKTIAAGAPPSRGEMLFHDASLSPQRWQSCSSCHPDARVDGLNWDLLNDGIGNPKNTRSLVNAHLEGSVMWTGVRDSAATAVRSGMRHILFIEPSEPEARAIEDWLKSLRTMPGPAKDKAAVQRGRALFFRRDVGCSVCHPPPFYSDRQMHGEYKTPSLLELWRTAPYLHDGSAATVREAVTGDQRGHTSHLSKREVEDLIAFLLSL